MFRRGHRKPQERGSRSGLDLFILDNCYDGPTAIRNVEEFIKNSVDLITYFGVDNYRVVIEAGEAHAVARWCGEVVWVVGLDLTEAGQLVQSRLTGAFDGIRSGRPDLPVEIFVRMDGRGLRNNKSKKLVSDFLDRHLRDKHILIAGATDSSALGAADTVREHKHEKHVAIVGQDCIAQAIAEMQKGKCPLIGSVSHEPGSYGPSLIHLGLSLLRGQTVSPYNYITHKMVTRTSPQQPPQN